MKLKLPIKSPIKPTMTQGYANTSFNEWYHEHGINNSHHNGCDFTCGSPVKTYGTPLVAPFNGKVTVVTFSEPMSTKGNGVRIKSEPLDIDGVQTILEVVLWHTGEVRLKVGDKIKEGDVICYIGNSGTVFPEPTPNRPFDGSHLHLMVYAKTKKGSRWITKAPVNTINGESDPLEYFDKDSWYIGEDSGSSHDLNPLAWRWSKLGITEWWLRLIEALKFLKG